MKKLFISGICALLSFSMIGCSNNKQKLKDQVKEEVKQSSEEKKKEETKKSVVDEAYLEAMKTGLQNRWKLAKKNANAVFSSDWAKYSQAELDEIEGFANQEFTNKELKDMVLSYIDCLKAQIAAAKNANKDLANSFLDYSNPSVKRVNLLKNFVDEYGLSVDKDYQDDLKELVDNTKDSYWDEQGLVSELKIKEINDSSMVNRVLQISGVNNTDYTFNHLYFDLQIEASDGEILETVQTNDIKSLKPGQKFNTISYLPVDRELPEVKDMLVEVFFSYVDKA